ncbi:MULTISPECIES: hypothetical protein [Deefgea]|uniref:Uncharacterized protein n=1 Tax=Deefgea chitinilytica TaxID=570276 RepID=A0ABS2CDD0_9NEIS|nr:MULTISPECIES: hypothetical protein [Deefgea]MBM5572163.1 hypothetical protein [Deefgea chitinilytica]MBM9889398.1 hypothetical protein [Deefgea sp. CFH1-16]
MNKTRFRYHKQQSLRTRSASAWFLLIPVVFLIAWLFLTVFQNINLSSWIVLFILLLLVQSFLGFPKTYICINLADRLLHRETVWRGKVLSRGREISLDDFDFMYADFQETNESGEGYRGFIKLFSRKRREFNLRCVDGTVADLLAEMERLSAELALPAKDYTRLM